MVNLNVSTPPNIVKALPQTSCAKPNIQTPQDTVSFSGMNDLLKSKPGKLGLAGTVFIALLGLAGAAKAHVLTDRQGNAIGHYHDFNNGKSRYDDGMPEYETRPGGVIEKFRVFDGENGPQIDTEYGDLIPDKSRRGARREQLVPDLPPLPGILQDLDENYGHFYGDKQY